MRIRRFASIRILAGLVVSALVAGTSAGEQEKKIKRSDLPPAVEKTAQAQSAGATIKGFNEEKEHGKTFYEIEMVVNGHMKDVLVDPAGTVVEVEEQVQLDSLPAAVKAGLQARAVVCGSAAR